MPVTIKDIARIANVSITTVSRVLNNKSEGIGDDTRKKVLSIIQELDYRPNSIARSMITKKTNTIGLIIPDIRNPFFPELVRGAEDVAKQSNYNIFLCNTDGDKASETEYIQLMQEKSVDGIIFTHSYATLSKQIEALANQHNTPIVLLDRGLDDDQFSGVYIDNEKAGYLATKFLLELNHVKIGCITGPSHIPNSNKRLKGYAKALDEWGIVVNQNVIIQGDYQWEGGYVAAKQLLQKEKVSAIFAFNDLMAFGVYQAAGELGMRIPDDLSVIGFDNLKYNEFMNPRLTTIDQSTYKMGEAAIQLLLKQIEAEEAFEHQTIYLEPNLIVRESCMRYET
ncbi:LacI family DNA-binding transcriptional regulator [Bacillus sp. FJAT-50079]|uniref:LacI family DNA-binding transcriptional regulator n=1 Tax=Bacillus sp. FJAT-50079 TaxID=2833577 RepID=UPI001BC91B1D|nr:LacI family DNA-binding transcriptional regulator [Bacillus sp. FJAT-50079]MBS4206695.1 LacI family DNA-binding transcriptional regulator [Bacillus sp. FJAT-50079]